MSSAAKLLHAGRMEPEVYIHPTACVDQPIEIGSGSKIWHFCHLMPGARIGRECVLGQNVFVGKEVRIGNRVKIQNNVSVYSGVTLEDEVFCGPSVVFTNVLTPRSAIPRNDDRNRLQTRVGQGATIGANATVVCGVSIGRYAMVGAGAVVTRDVPDFAQVTGNPAVQSGWRCACGLDLKFEDATAVCGTCKKAYRLESGSVTARSSLDR